MNWRIPFAILTFVTLVLFARGYLTNSEDFRVSNIQYEIPYHPEWEVDEIDPVQGHLLGHILSQNFTYFGQGEQCYAFLSDDGNWVLKMFIFKHLKPSPLLSLVPSVGSLNNYKLAIEKEKGLQLESLLNSYKLAYDCYRPESGCVFLHFNQTQKLNKAVHVTDRVGRQWAVDLDPLAFVIQQRAVPFRDELDQLLSRGDLDRARYRIHQVFALYLRQYILGIHDEEKEVMTNNGFVGEKPIHFGVENLTVDETIKISESQIEHLVRVGLSISQWLEVHYPEYRQELVVEMENGMERVFGEKVYITGSTIDRK